VTKRGTPVKLTRKEFDILYCLMSRAGRVVTYAKLLTAVWGAESREEVEYLRTFVASCAKRLKTTRRVRCICSPMFTSATASPMRRCFRTDPPAGEAEEDKHEPEGEHEPKDAL
jgi:hypothetical protein